MRHAAHKANKDSVQRTSPSALFRSSRGSHTARAVRAVRAANGDAVALAIDPVLAAKLNEVAPMTRRAIRETAKAAQRKSYMMSSASLAALVGTAATALAFSNIQQSSNSRLLADDPATTTTQLARRDRFDGLAFRIPYRARPHRLRPDRSRGHERRGRREDEQHDRRRQIRADHQ